MSTAAMTSSASATVRAAGGILWRRGSDELAVVHRPRYDDWSLPKGKLDAGEHPLAGACREVLEETGIRPTAGPRLPTVRYDIVDAGTTRTKTVDYWSMRCDEDSSFVANSEVDALRWCTADAACEMLTYEHDRRVVRAAAALPMETTTILLVRHARAGDKRTWRGNDAERPLDDLGRGQARRLGELLPMFGPRHILSAPHVRCVDTVAPLASQLGLPVRRDAVWSEDHHAEHPEAAADMVRGWAAGSDAVVVSSQGGVIPDTVALLADVDDLPLPDPAARKGSVWVLSFADERLVAADHLPPP